MDGRELEFSDGFGDLHTQSYRRILAGEGFRNRDVLPSVQIVSQIRNAAPVGLTGEYHPILKSIQS